jgi:hypothetical protein
MYGGLLNVKELWFYSALGMKCSTLRSSALLCLYYIGNEILHFRSSFILMFEFFQKCVEASLDVKELWFSSASGMKCITQHWTVVLCPHCTDNEILHFRGSFILIFEFFFWKCVGDPFDMRELWFYRALGMRCSVVSTLHWQWKLTF